MSPRGRERVTATILAGITLSVAAAFATSFRGGWQFDDWRVIVGDPRVASVEAWWASMPGIRPLLKLTYAVNRQTGLGLAGFHAVNVAVHAAAAVVAYLLLLRIGRRIALAGSAHAESQSSAQTGSQSSAQTGSQSSAQTESQPSAQTESRSSAQTESQPSAQTESQSSAQTESQPSARPERSGREAAAESKGEAPRSWPEPAALVGALLFALHPAQAEAVTYLSGRSASLSGALALAATLAFVAGRADGRRGLVHLASPALMLLSLGVKETAVVLPAALLLLEAAALSDRGRRFEWRPALRAISVHLAVAAAAVAALLASPVYRSMLVRSLSLRGAGLQLLTQARATGWLAGQLVPLRGLSADPGLEPVTPATAAGPAVLALAVFAVAAVSLAQLRRRPAPALAVAWFLCWLAPQGWWLPRAELANERQLYVALLGPAWLAALGLARLRAPRALRIAVAGAAVLALGLVTAARSRVYEDEVSFWSDAAAKAPRNARAHANLGYALALSCRPAEAEAAFLRAAALAPDDPRPLVHLRLLREGALLPDDAAAKCQAPQR